MGQVAGKIDAFAPVAANATKYYFEYKVFSDLLGLLVLLCALTIFAIAFGVVYIREKQINQPQAPRAQSTVPVTTIVRPNTQSYLATRSDS
jgi:hypothetical protein